MPFVDIPVLIVVIMSRRGGVSARTHLRGTLRLLTLDAQVYRFLTINNVIIYSSLVGILLDGYNVENL